MMLLWPSFHDVLTAGTHNPGGIPRANFLPNCPYYFSVFMGVPYAFCVWCMVSSLHSTYFFVIQLLLRVIYLKKKRNLCHSSVSTQWMAEHLETATSVLQAWCGTVIGLQPGIKMQNWVIVPFGVCLLQNM